MKVLEKAGFSKEGVHRNAVYKNRKVLDEHLFVIMNPDADKIL
jgi:RimJ/RimL family protein N-acetyltransferase